MKLRAWLGGVLCASFVAITALPDPTRGQALELADPFHCELLAESQAVQVPAGIAALVHPFGSDTDTYPNEFDPASTLLSKASRLLEPKVERVFHDRLEQNFPNPFNPQTTLAYSVKRASDVTLTVYDVGGRRVRELVNEHRMPGAYRVIWDGTDGRGTPVASGVYFYKLIAGSFTDTKKMILLK